MDSTNGRTGYEYRIVLSDGSFWENWSEKYAGVVKCIVLCGQRTVHILGNTWVFLGVATTGKAYMDVHTRLTGWVGEMAQ